MSGLNLVLPRGLVLTAFLAACGAPPPPTDDDTDSPVDTDDTDTDDTGAFETGRWNDTDTDTDTDTDVGPPPDTDTDIDSAVFDTDSDACLFGEVADCEGRCFPAYMLGDGTCDDGSTLPADFACDLWAYDRGDCADTDTDVSSDCTYELEFRTITYAAEIGYRIEDSAGNVVFRINYGDYPGDNTVYRHQLTLPDGTYRFIGTDSWGDGWHGAYWELSNPKTQGLVARGDNLGGQSSSYSWSFNAVCDVLPCDVDAVLRTGADGAQAGWEVYTSVASVAAGAIGSAAPNGTTTTRFTLRDGLAYTLRLYDAGRDGWNEEGSLELRYPGGQLLWASRLTTGGASALPFPTITADCALAAEPATDAPGPVVELPSCDQVRVVSQMTTKANEVGWTLYELPGWRVAGQRSVGSLPNNLATTDRINLREGRYFLQMVDRGRDAWGGRLGLVDDALTGYFEATHAAGSQSGRYFDVGCPDPDTDDTDETDETDDTDAPPACLPGALADCLGVCWPRNYLGDGVCDDGTGFAPNFDCEAFSEDNGDCAVAP